MNTTRELLQRHTADLRRPRFDQSQAEIEALVTTVHDPDATDEQAEAAALAFIEDWYGHPVYRKCARYGVILHTVRHRPEVADKVAEFGQHIDKVRGTDTGLAGWYVHYTGQEVTR